MLIFDIEVDRYTFRGLCRNETVNDFMIPYLHLSFTCTSVFVKGRVKIRRGAFPLHVVFI